MPKKKPEWFVHRTLVDGKVASTIYWPNMSSAVLHELHNYGKGDLTIESYCDAHGLGPERPTSFRKLDQMERDLLRLSTEEFKKKYPNADVSDTLKTSQEVEAERRREAKNHQMYLMEKMM
jgi:hypothetical protein